MAPDRWTFGPFEFDGAAYELRRSGLPVPLAPKAADLLRHLLAASDRVATREELEAALYPGVTVSPHALRNVVLKLREALGEEEEEFVETVPRRGWRMRSAARAVAPPTPLSVVHVPAERDSFHGRVADGALLSQALARGRLVTLLGPGGVGKTRFAIHYARQTAREWPGGVSFCDLQDASGPSDVLAAVARALGAPLRPGDGVDQLGLVLADRGRSLLILDNFEGLVPLAEGTAARWLDAAAELRIVVTSRARLGLPGEQILDLGPLEPEAATALFVDRARAADPRFAAEREHLDGLVSLLDHLPLAVELAAARVRVMGVGELRARMGRRFDLLRSGTGRPARHATLRAALDGSWEALSPAEQSALGALTVFEGGWDLAAAEAVLEEGPATADRLEALVDQSLVQRAPGGRFDLLSSVREHAAERLADPAALDRASRAHGRYFARVARALLEGGFPEARVNAERGNLIAACRAAIGRGDARAAAPLLVAVRAAIERTGPYSLIAELAQAALPLAREVGGPPLAEVLWVLGTCEGWSGETFSAHERLLEAVARSEGGPDPKLPSRIRLALATSLLNLGRSAEAAQLAESALPVLAGGPGEALAHWVLGASARYLGRMSEAHASFSSAVEAARRGGERGMENRALAAVAIVLHGVGRTDEGREGYQRALELARERADRSLEAQTLGNLGALLQEEGEVEEAERCYQEAIRLYRALGNRREVANILGNVGNLELAEGRLVEAEARYAEALRAHREIGNRREEGIVVGNLARLWARRGDLARAEALLLEAVAVHREVRNQRFLGIALTHLGELHLPVAPDLAKIELAEAVELHRTVGGPRALGWSLGALARAHLALGDEAAAGSAAEEALERLRAGHGKDFAAEILSAVAEVVSALGQPERSRELLAELEGPFGESVRRDAGSTGG